ncbi:hypothetical protein [Pseudomonas sp. TAE6080]|uniref:hypothetical protein n=1 Tax=Pseudomonas sp. TAE6080 TaxID=2840374 RepID=UPI002078A715|nr:hypothetical protein [Pseudomonas sp. TAE6080]
MSRQRRLDLKKSQGRKTLYDSNFFIEDPWPLLKRYMPVIGGDLLVGCFSIAITTVLVTVTYLSTLPTVLLSQIFFFGSLGSGLIFTIAKFKVLSGRTHWVWISTGIYFTCLLISLPAIIYRPSLYLYLMALVGPLAGLLILNSNRCKEMRKKMVEIRNKREEKVVTLKKQGKWKWW